MDYVTFYNQAGTPIAYIGDNQDYPAIYLFDGTPVAWISDEAIYSYAGRYLGWIQNGWVWDRDGFPAFFTTDAEGGPSKPSRQSRPSRASRASRPSRASRESRPSKPSRSSTWSPLSSESFFRQA